jgi:hypothetical protein
LPLVHFCGAKRVAVWAQVRYRLGSVMYWNHLKIFEGVHIVPNFVRLARLSADNAANARLLTRLGAAPLLYLVVIWPESLLVIWRHSKEMGALLADLILSVLSPRASWSVSMIIMRDGVLFSSLTFTKWHVILPIKSLEEYQTTWISDKSVKVLCFDAAVSEWFYCP